MLLGNCRSLADHKRTQRGRFAKKIGECPLIGVAMYCLCTLLTAVPDEVSRLCDITGSLCQIIARCTEYATVFQANNVCNSSIKQVKACLAIRYDNLMSGSSLEDKS